MCSVYIVSISAPADVPLCFCEVEQESLCFGRGLATLLLPKMNACNRALLLLRLLLRLRQMLASASTTSTASASTTSSNTQFGLLFATTEHAADTPADSTQTTQQVSAHGTSRASNTSSSTASSSCSSTSEAIRLGRGEQVYFADRETRSMPSLAEVLHPLSGTQIPVLELAHRWQPFPVVLDQQCYWHLKYRRHCQAQARGRCSIALVTSGSTTVSSRSSRCSISGGGGRSGRSCVAAAHTDERLEATYNAAIPPTSFGSILGGNLD